MAHQQEFPPEACVREGSAYISTDLANSVFAIRYLTVFPTACLWTELGRQLTFQLKPSTYFSLSNDDQVWSLLLRTDVTLLCLRATNEAELRGWQSDLQSAIEKYIAEIVYRYASLVPPFLRKGSLSQLHSGAVLRDDEPLFAVLQSTEMQLHRLHTNTVVDVWPLSAETQVVREERYVNCFTVGDEEGRLFVASQDDTNRWIEAIQAAVASLAAAHRRDTDNNSGSVIRRSGTFRSSSVAAILASPSPSPASLSPPTPEEDSAPFGTVVKRGSSRIGTGTFVCKRDAMCNEETLPIRIVLFNATNRRQNFVLLAADKFAKLTVAGLKRHAFNRCGIPEERLSLEIDGVVLTPDTCHIAHWLPQGGRVAVFEAQNTSDCESDQSNHSIEKDDADRFATQQRDSADSSSNASMEEKELRVRLRAAEGGYSSLLREHQELLAEHEDLQKLVQKLRLQCGERATGILDALPSSSTPMTHLQLPREKASLERDITLQEAVRRANERIHALEVALLAAAAPFAGSENELLREENKILRARLSLLESGGSGQKIVISPKRRDKSPATSQFSPSSSPPSIHSAPGSPSASSVSASASRMRNSHHSRSASAYAMPSFLGNAVGIGPHEQQAQQRESSRPMKVSAWLSRSVAQPPHSVSPEDK